MKNEYKQRRSNSKLDSYFKEKEDKSKEMQEHAETNEILNKVNRKRFRLLHAVFHDRFRESLLNLYISKERRAFDAQNTTAAPPCFFRKFVHCTMMKAGHLIHSNFLTTTQGSEIPFHCHLKRMMVKIMM